MRKLLVGLFLAVAPVAAQQPSTQSAADASRLNAAKKAANPGPLSVGFIRPATRALNALMQGEILPSKEPTPADDRTNEAQTAASTSADKAFVEALKSFKQQKLLFDFMKKIKRFTAEVETKTGGPDVPEWRCKWGEDLDVCPSFQKAVESKLAADRDLAKSRITLEDCAEALASALKAKAFGGAPSCGSKQPQ